MYKENIFRINYRIDFKEDNAIKNEVDELALDIGKDTTNDDLLVIKNERIQALLAKKEKERLL